MGREIEKSERMVLMNTIVEDYILKGVNNATKIAKELGVPRSDVVLYIEEWKSFAKNSDRLQDRASELVTELDRSYDQIINELWVTHLNAPAAKDQAVILKTIADVIAKRQEVLQRAGLYDHADTNAKMAEVEAQAAQITQLLKDIALKYKNKYPEVQIDIIDGLGRIFKEAQGN